MDRNRKFRRLNFQAAPLVFAVIVGLGIGLLIGWLAKTTKEYSAYQQHLLNVSENMARDNFEEDPQGIIKKIIDSVDAKNIKNHLKAIVSVPHLTGTMGDDQLVRSIYSKWEEFGFDDVKIIPYKVLLSFSDSSKPNTVELVSKKSQDILYMSTLPILQQRNNWKGHSYPYPYFAYSPNGSVTGEPVFANHGTEDDYITLTFLKVSVVGKIVIVKAGMESCGKQVLFAQNHGAIGLLMYPDPSNYAQEGTDSDRVFPSRWWLPKDGIFRCSVFDSFGDPSTPGYPSINGVYHFGNKTQLPKIIAQPINYQDAKEILGRMGGARAPREWQGGLDIDYHIGPGFADTFKNAIELRVTSYNKLVHDNAYNLIGTIKGTIEPDRHVLIGNHRDAWVGGAVDPGSGTAVIMEITSIFGTLLSKGWRPRRTIKVCLWGAEEFGLIGSTEWVEENLLELQSKAISYLNVDTCVIGDTFSPQLSPTLNQAVAKVAKLVPDPNSKNQRLYDTWMFSKSQQDTNEGDNILGANSDYAAFAFMAGIPVMDIFWQSKNLTAVFLYPAYHTSYETVSYVEKFLDPGFLRHAACAQFSALMVHLLSDSAVIPFNLSAITDEILSHWQYLNQYEAFLSEKNISLHEVTTVMDKMQNAANIWENHLKNADKQNPFIVRSINDHQLLVHKALLNRQASPSSDSWFYRYGIEKSIFSIVDHLQIVDQPDGNTKETVPTEEIKQHLSDILVVITQLSNLLASFDWSAG